MKVSLTLNRGKEKIIEEEVWAVEIILETGEAFTVEDPHPPFFPQLRDKATQPLGSIKIKTQENGLTITPISRDTIFVKGE